MENTEHIFDNRQILQNFVVRGGNKISIPPHTKKYILSLVEVKEFFFRNATDSEYLEIKNYLYPKAKKEISNEKIILWCTEVIENALTNNRSLDLNGRISLKELFMERIALRGSAYAVLFLKKYYSKNTRAISI